MAVVFLSYFKVLAVEFPHDTTIVEFSDKDVNKRITVITTGEKEVQLPISLDLNTVLRELGVDTTERERALLLLSDQEGRKDTLVYITQSGQKIQIVTKKPVGEKEPRTSVQIERSEEPGAAEEKEPEHQDGPDSWNIHIRRTKNGRFFPKGDFGLYLGLNNFAHANPASNGSNYGLRLWPSRYIALSFRKNLLFTSQENFEMCLSLGPEIAWHNFMFKNDYRAEMGDKGQVMFNDAGYGTKKSKLVMPYLNFPVLLYFGFKEEKFKLGLGGYVGYRIGGRVKVKSTKGGKIKERDDFGMTDVPYGLTVELGKKNGLTVFFRHDLSTVFKANQQYAKDLQAFSFGLRL